MLLGLVGLHIVVGGFFGDEGKGKTVAFLALSRRPWGCVRTGASNAGHTVVYGGRRWKLRVVPSCFVSGETRLFVARGALVGLDVVLGEVRGLGVEGRFWLDYGTGIITGEHVLREKEDEVLASIGSTMTGVGAAMVDRVLRRLRLAGDYPELEGMVVDVQAVVAEAVDRGERVVVEATQGYWLSLYHGTYPYVTSRDTTAAAALSELGLGPRDVDRVTVVFKSYVTRVGGGPLPGELSAEEAAERGWVEYGTVTGRPRRAAPFNPGLARAAVRANTATDAAIMKLDVLFPGARCKRRWDELPREAREWVERVEDSIGVPVSLVGTGEEAECMVDRSGEVGLE